MIDDLSPKEVRLKMTSIGEVMISGLLFTFGVESVGLASDKGLCVTVSGEAVDSGRVTFSDFQLITGGQKAKRLDFPLVTKKDGKRIYQLRLTDLRLTDPSQEEYHEKEEDRFLAEMKKQMTFKVMPHFVSGGQEDTPELMISVYPFENPLNGAATDWVNVTDDEDYFLHKLQKKGKKKK
ncbi:MAG: hypothetical protein IJ806_04520 [Ruminococcus sp.]|nr:hypothetical protein [Ruminococcus sp.]